MKIEDQIADEVLAGFAVALAPASLEDLRARIAGAVEMAPLDMSLEQMARLIRST